MTSKLITAALAAAALAAPGVASAETGAYGTLGYTNFDFEQVNLDAVTGRLGYQFHKNFAVEGEASFGIGEDTVGGVNVELDNALAVFGVGIVPVAPNFELIGRVGYGSVEATASASGFSGSGDGDGFAIGAGGQYMFSPTFGVRGEYTRLEGDDVEGDTFSISGVVKFGPVS